MKPIEDCSYVSQVTVIVWTEDNDVVEEAAGEAADVMQQVVQEPTGHRWSIMNTERTDLIGPQTFWSAKGQIRFGLMITLDLVEHLLRVEHGVDLALAQTPEDFLD